MSLHQELAACRTLRDILLERIEEEMAKNKALQKQIDEMAKKMMADEELITELCNERNDLRHRLDGKEKNQITSDEKINL